MLAAVVSDLHLGTLAGADVVRDPTVADRLVAAAGDADRVVLLGDTLELRERPLADVLAIARPFFEALGEATAGRRVTIVPGNHDHGLAEPWLGRMRLDGEALAAVGEWEAGPGDGIAGRLGAWMPRTEVTVAYPGLQLRDDVYATHGHYLDVHLTLPRIESLAAAALARVTGRTRAACRTAADHEAVLAPLYAFYASMAQGAPARALSRGGNLSRDVWHRVSANGTLGGLLLGRAAIPAAVAAINRIGLGPFSAELSGAELRRSGLRAMGTVTDGLGVQAEHILFGHTHRAGPFPGDDPAEWRTPAGTRLWNTGSWYSEHTTLSGRRNPYAPGTVILVPERGAPELRNALGYIAAPTGAGSGSTPGPDRPAAIT